MKSLKILKIVVVGEQVYCHLVMHGRWPRLRSRVGFRLGFLSIIDTCISISTDF